MADRGRSEGWRRDRGSTSVNGGDRFLFRSAATGTRARARAPARPCLPRRKTVGKAAKQYNDKPPDVENARASRRHGKTVLGGRVRACPYPARKTILLYFTRACTYSRYTGVRARWENPNVRNTGFRGWGSSAYFARPFVAALVERHTLFIAHVRRVYKYNIIIIYELCG